MHQLIAYAPQNAVLFEASLRDNLLLGANRHQDDIETWLQRLGLAHLLQRQGGRMHRSPWRKIPSPAERFIGWGCCGPGSATSQSKFSMNRRLSLMPRPLSRCVR